MKELDKMMEKINNILLECNIAQTNKYRSMSTNLFHERDCEKTPYVLVNTKVGDRQRISIFKLDKRTKYDPIGKLVFSIDFKSVVDNSATIYYLLDKHDVFFKRFKTSDELKKYIKDNLSDDIYRTLKTTLLVSINTSI